MFKILSLAPFTFIQLAKVQPEVGRYRISRAATPSLPPKLRWNHLKGRPIFQIPGVLAVPAARDGLQIRCWQLQIGWSPLLPPLTVLLLFNHRTAIMASRRGYCAEHAYSRDYNKYHPSTGSPSRMLLAFAASPVATECCWGQFIYKKGGWWYQ